MSQSNWEKVKAARVPRGWVLEEYNPIEGQVRAYRHEMVNSMRSKAVSPWISLFKGTLEECLRERDKLIDKTHLRIRNEETDEVWQGE